MNLDPFASTVSVKAGEPFKIKIPFKGSPAPVASWFNVSYHCTFYVQIPSPLQMQTTPIGWFKQGPKEIFKDSRFNMEVTEDEVILTCSAAMKADEGPYACTLKNKLGSDTAKVQVTVLG